MIYGLLLTTVFVRPKLFLILEFLGEKESLFFTSIIVVFMLDLDGPFILSSDNTVQFKKFEHLVGKLIIVS